ncbi:uncharacterized protein LOC132849137 isoform X2 [Tachysurus vachellii]|uniref:uncharacterized protein LOC132849137 isoform X2 n=1 Tax=Tachysurus vachellii TaxID=175792 RepID=UPI00296A991A|nr:uncharacterized protein LOC132849137 isoform X2 [Tachysurus vachellii]
MGNQEGKLTIHNKTQYKWTACMETQEPWPFPDTYLTFTVGGYGRQDVNLIAPIAFLGTYYIKVKYGECSEIECYKNPDLWYMFDPNGDSYFTIRESGDHKQIHLDCNRHYEKKKPTCPNYGKIEDDAREEEERREREKQRRQAQLEHEKRIEEQIRRESELAAEKLSRARETLKEKQRLRGHELHHQTHVMQQPLEAEIEIDEVSEIEKKFSDLLCEYQITDEEDSEETLEDRMKTLQNELMVEYCKKHNLTSSCVFSFDTAVGYETLPLHDRLTVLETVLQLVFEEDENDHTHKHDRDFLLDVLELLQDDHPSLAFNLLQNVLQTDMQLSTQSKEILCHIAFNNTWKLAEITDFMRYVVRNDKDQVQAILHIAQTYKLEYGNVLNALDKSDPLRWLKGYVDTERQNNADTIISEMRNSNYPENVLTILEDVLVYLERELPKCKRTHLHKNDIQSVKKMVKELDFTNPDRQVLKSVLVQMSLAVKMCSAVTIQKGKEEKVIEGYLPRLTQIAALVVFLLRKSKTNTGCLLEIGTGEGKSCILAMLAVIHAMRGVKVDIVTSSPVLARRDLEEWSKLYKMFDITSSAVPPVLNDVSSEELEELTQGAYKQDVVYSTVGTFAADTLKQEFEKKTTRGDRRFEMVLVDEVDYMTLDNGVQITFLSHESSGLQHLEQVLASIWAIISACRPIEVEKTEETMWATRVQSFHTAALIAMIGSDKNDKFSPLEILLPGIELGFYSEEDFENLKESINEEGEKEQGDIENEAWKTIMAKTGIEQQYDLLNVLEMGMEDKVAFNCYSYQPETRKVTQFREKKTKTDQNINMLLLENGKACEILSENVLIEATVSQLKSKIKYSRQCSSEEDKESLVIPSFLEKYLENQLPLFVENALKAIQMTKGREYMIERSLKAQGLDVDEDDQHLYHAIIPVDFQASGMLEKRKRWGDGLQQFLEMKHQLTLSPLSNVTNYMSNSNFFKRYLMGKGIFGVSGTLGGDADKGFLARHYKTDSYVIPPHQRQKVTELPAVQVGGGTDQWIQTICATVSKVSKRGQVVLVVCEDVNTANVLNDKIAAETKHSVTMYTMSERHNIENQEFGKGRIIITTNLGGRGTDIKVTEEVNRCGGLFVLLTYFTNNRRVEKQVFGRTGRKGTPGMVQVILNHDRLAMAYRGHSIEVMRELREEYEVNRIKEMEKEKLAEIEMKEELFSTFCQFLSDFDQHYSTVQKIDIFEVKIKDVHCYFESFHDKMDYHPALNALKESWGIWLILHTDQINIHSDLTHLKEDLIQNLQDTSNKLLQGHSENVYDHIQQALGRTALHHQNKNKCDYGAKTYWKKASDSDNYYRAVALYNQAYITINLAKKGYKSEACSLLKEAEKTLDVYISETSRTLSFCSLSVTRDFEPHHSGSCNLQIQMQARMNLFNSWKQNIKNSLDMLGSGSGDFETVDLTLYSLSNEEDFVSSSELGLFRNYGLAVVFEVKQKPKFSFDALICCFLGVVQVVAGVLVCTLSLGSMSSFGLGLISEGVSDMINGVMGMINGTFDWASWAISKAISIGISLVCGGFSVLKRSFSAVKNAASNILNGTTSLKSVACNALKSGKNMFVSACKSTKSMVSSMKNLTWTAVKPTLKHSSKYAVQELAIQGVNTALNTGIDVALQKTFHQVFLNTFKESVCSKLHENKEFVRALTDFISSGIPKAALQKRSGSYRISETLKNKMTDYMDVKTKSVIYDLLVNCKHIHQVINILSQVWDKSAEHVAHRPHTNIFLTAASMSTSGYEMYYSIPTKRTIDCNFVPALLKSMHEEALFKTYDNDGRDKLEDVERLKIHFIDKISEVFSQIMVEKFSGSATSLFTKTFTRQLNSATGKVVGNLLGRHETQRFFDSQHHHRDLKSITECKERSVNEEELNQLTCFATKITDEQKPATALEVLVLTKSNLLDGKGICLSVVDHKGNLLTYENYPGTDPAAGNINLVLTKTPQTSPGSRGILSNLNDKVMGKDTPQSGHISIIRPDGSRETVNSSNQNCLYHAIIQATTNDPKVDLNQKAVELRHKLQHEILANPYKYAKAVKIQIKFDRTNSSNKFKIEAGLKEEDEKAYKAYKENKDEITIIDEYKLGEVDTYGKLSAKKKPTPGVVEADHIPPKNSLWELRNILINGVEKRESLEQKNKALYDLVMNNKDNNEMDQNNNDNNKAYKNYGRQLISMNTLYWDHRRALTTGNSHESKACRELLTDTFGNGDVVKALKMSLIMAHPVSSDYIRAELAKVSSGPDNNTPKSQVKGGTDQSKKMASGLTPDNTNKYYKDGFKNTIKVYKEMKVIDQNQETRLMAWVEDDKYLWGKNVDIIITFCDYKLSQNSQARTKKRNSSRSKVLGESVPNQSGVPDDQVLHTEILDKNKIHKFAERDVD